MYQLDILTRIPEPQPDGVIRIRPGESAIVRTDKSDPVPQIRGRPVEWRDKTIPALVIVLGNNLDEIFKIFQAPEDPEDRIPFLVISSDPESLRSCRADGKVLCCAPAEYSSEPSQELEYLHEIVRKTEYCFFICSLNNSALIRLAGEIARFAREQNTLSVLAVTGEPEPGSREAISAICGKFHTVFWNPENFDRESAEQIRDLCEATIEDVVSYGSRRSLESGDRFAVRELLFNGGTCHAAWHAVGNPDAHELVRSFSYRSRVIGSYSLLRIPWESTIDAATGLRNSLIDILNMRFPTRFPHQIRLEGYNPETEGQYDLSIWIFSGRSGFP